MSNTPPDDTFHGQHDPAAIDRATANQWSEHVFIGSADIGQATVLRDTVEQGSGQDVYTTHNIDPTHTMAAVRNIFLVRSADTGLSKRLRS